MFKKSTEVEFKIKAVEMVSKKSNAVEFKTDQMVSKKSLVEVKADGIYISIERMGEESIKGNVHRFG